MNTASIDAFIPAHPKDYIKLPYVVEALWRHTHVLDIHIVTPDPDALPHNGLESVHIHADSDVIDFDKNCIPYRPNWVYQQFLKLFQDVTDSDWFLGMDADFFFNCDVDMFDGDHPIMILIRDQLLTEYFEFNQAMIGIGKVYPNSFLSDCTLYNKKLIAEMLATNSYTSLSFMEKASGIITNSCFIGDAELYGSWVYANYPDLYRFRKLSNSMNGKYSSGQYTASEIEELLAIHRGNPDTQTISVHSWEG